MSSQHQKDGAPSALHHTQRIFDNVLLCSIALGSIWIAGLVVVVVADVVGRVAFGRPLAGAFEITTFSIIGIVYLQLAHTVRSNRMTRSDLLGSIIGRKWPKIWRFLEATFLGLCCFVFALLAYFVGQKCVQAFNQGQYYGSEGAIRFASWPIYLVATFGCISATIQYLLQAAFKLLDVQPAAPTLPFDQGNPS